MTDEWRSKPIDPIEQLTFGGAFEKLRLSSDWPDFGEAKDGRGRPSLAR